MAMTQLDLFSILTARLPDEPELARRFADFNRRYFDGSLPVADVRWSSRMRIAGTCDGRNRTITLSRVYHAHFPEDVDDTLKHEMIHLRHHSHDAAFRREAERIGATIHCKEYPGLHPRARFVYICPHCRTTFHRSKRERLYCGLCARTRLDARFILVLRQPAARRHQTEAALAARRPPRARPKRRTSR
jgi:predicted SprT family Zn-dependent metalloprotease